MPMSDEEFAQQRTRLVRELYRPSSPVVEAAAPDGKVDAPAGSLPAPEGAERPLWELSPQELQAKVTAALWPTDDSNHRWVPRAPISVSDYLANGV